MLNNDHLNKLEIKKRLLEKLNTISGNQADQESQIMISYSAKKENYLDVNDSEIDKDVKYFKSMSQGYHLIEKHHHCGHGGKQKKPTKQEKWEKKKLRHRRKREVAIANLETRINENQQALNEK